MSRAPRRALSIVLAVGVAVVALYALVSDWRSEPSSEVALETLASPRSATPTEAAPDVLLREASPPEASPSEGKISGGELAHNPLGIFS